MKIRRHWSLALLMIAVAVLAIRLAWVVSNSTIGWQPWRDQWLDIVTNLVGTETKSLGEKDPQEQAEFWLKQVSQVEKVDLDAETALGAAWMLDTPQLDFYRYHIKRKEGFNHSIFPLSWGLELDRDAIKSLTEKFELLCRDECLEKVETAVRLDSDNVELWRAYALLLFQQKSPNLNLVPRRADWRAILDDCAKHDPGNALYDYLAAMYLWSSSAEYDWIEEELVLNMKDRAKFDEGTKRYQTGLSKPILNFGTIDYIATLNFLNETSLSRPNQLEATENRNISSRITSLLFQILRLQSRQARIDEKAGKYSDVIASANNLIRLSDQVLNGDGHIYYSPAARILREWSLANLKEIYEMQPDLIDDVKARKITEEYQQLQLESEVFQVVMEQYEAKRNLSQLEIPIWVLLIMPTVQMCFLVTFCLGLFSGFAALLTGKQRQDDPFQTRWYMHFIAWIVGMGFTITLLGLVPAKIISPSIQTSFVRGAIWGSLVVLLFGLFCLLRKWFQLSWTQTTALWSISCLPFVVGFHLSALGEFIFHVFSILHPIITILFLFALMFLSWKLLRTLLNFTQSNGISRGRKLFIGTLFLLFGFCTNLAVTTLAIVMSDHLVEQTWIEPKTWNEVRALNITPHELQNEIQLNGANWFWALIQWDLHFGPFIASFMALGILVCCQTLHRARREGRGFREMLRPWKYQCLREDNKVIVKSCFVVSMIFMLVYLCVYPSVVKGLDKKYDYDYENLVSPTKVQNEIGKLTVQVKSDKPLMGKLRAEIEERNREIEERNKMREELKHADPTLIKQ